MDSTCVTIRLYVEKYEQDVFKHDMHAQTTLYHLNAKILSLYVNLL